MLREIQAIFLIQKQGNFTIRVGHESMSLGHGKSASFLEIIKLTVNRENQTLIGSNHRLFTLSQIIDTQSGVPHDDPPFSVQIDILSIRPSMSDDFEHL